MRSSNTLSWWLLVGLAGLSSTGCAADELDSDDWDESQETNEIAVAGRWIPSASVTANANQQHARYDDAPSWSGGRNCGGSLLSGTRELGDYLRASFRGVRAYDGYVCRQNTANTSQTSMHGTGRALDVYIPLSGGQADNTIGDAVANWLIANASSLGVQLVIWDRSSWNASRGSGAKLRAYGGPHPHHDHLHIELNRDGASRSTAWFRDRGSVTPPGSSTPTPSTTPSTTPRTPEPTPPPVAGPRVRVVASFLNLRSGPGSSNSVLGVMPCGVALSVTANSNNWYQVNYNGTTGWASGLYLTPESSFSASVCGR